MDFCGGIKTSGEKRDFGTGAHRDSNTKVHKGRMDLIPAVAMHRFADFCRDIEIDIIGQHALFYYNGAMQSMYLWLEGQRPERDGGHFSEDNLSFAILNVIQMMQIQEDLPMWNPKWPNSENLERYDMLSPTFLRRVSVHYQLGGINYGDRNWELGMPVMVTWDSAVRHLVNWLERKADDEEDHLAAFGWNVMCTMHTIEMINRGILPESLYEPPMHRNVQVGRPYHPEAFDENEFGLYHAEEEFDKLFEEDDDDEAKLALYNSDELETHTGFCMSPYDADTCFDCFSEAECIKMGERDRMKNVDNVHYVVDIGWFFWDETSAHRNGPYLSRANAENALKDYCDHLNYGGDPKNEN